MVLGIDVGGTKILAIRMDNGEITERWQMSTKNGQVLENVGKIIASFPEERIGIGVPCYLRSGVCVKAPNIPELDGKSLKELFPRAQIFNDCTAMAYGEYVLRDKKYDPFFLVAIGTGIGAGLIYKGGPYVGKGSAMELGHLKGFSNLPCSCGKNGCLETVVGGRYVDVESMWVKAQNGDEDALKFFENYGRILAQGIAPAIQLLDPEMVVIGGGISSCYDLFISSLLNELQKLISFIDVWEIKFEKSISSETGAIGAALLAENYR